MCRSAVSIFSPYVPIGSPNDARSTQAIPRSHSARSRQCRCARVGRTAIACELALAAARAPRKRADQLCAIARRERFFLRRNGLFAMGQHHAGAVRTCSRLSALPGGSARIGSARGLRRRRVSAPAECAYRCHRRRAIAESAGERTLAAGLGEPIVRHFDFGTYAHLLPRFPSLKACSVHAITAYAPSLTHGETCCGNRPG